MCSLGMGELSIVVDERKMRVVELNVNVNVTAFMYHAGLITQL